MTPLTRYLAYALALALLAVAALGRWVDVDERALGAVPAQIQAARTQDALAATIATAQILGVRVALDQTDRDLAVQAQARADGHHEEVALGIQHRQDLAAAYFGEASHDQKAIDWGAQPVPLDFYLGLCAVLRDCPDGRPAAAAGDVTPAGAGGGPGPVRRNGAAAVTHGQPAADHPLPGGGAGSVQRRQGTRG